MLRRRNVIRSRESADELDAALISWREAMKRFEAASDDEVRFVALEVEAARQKYVYLLNKRKYECASEQV